MFDNGINTGSYFHFSLDNNYTMQNLLSPLYSTQKMYYLLVVFVFFIVIVISTVMYFFIILCYVTSYDIDEAQKSKNGRVGNRNVELKDLADESFHFCTTAQGRKVQEMIDNPNVALTFLWCYGKELRQVRIEGIAEQLNKSITQKYYDEEVLFCKVRAHVCVQGKPTDWNTLKEANDKLLKDVKENNKELPMPSHYRSFKIIPDRFDFYKGLDTNIGDRIIFTKEENKWEHARVGT